MSWISPTFDDGPPPSQHPKKKVKTTKPNENKELPTASTTEELTLVSCNWLEQYKPKNVAELAVNAKKVKELEDWLQQSISLNPRSKFLLLTGPSGCGKTTMVQTVCKSSGFKIFEWITPVDRPVDEESDFPSPFEFTKSSTKLFEEYLFRSSRYNSCLNVIQAKKVILVKDFPNVFIYNPSSFHEILTKLLQKCFNPIVFISSDESLCRKLFPATFKADCQLETLTLNLIPDQRMFKVLKSILSQENKKSSSVAMLSDESLSEICAACPGDLRSAISKLSFLSRKSNVKLTKPVPKVKLKKASDVNVNTPMDKDRRIDFFHGIGRVLYPKKVETGKDLKFVHSTEAIVEAFLSEPASFLSQLHENYPGKLGNVEDLRDAAERLSKSDLLRSRWQERDVFTHYSLAVAVQGLMVSNRAPQKARFEAFKRSQTSRMEVDRKDIELEGKVLFSELRVLDYESLVDVLPYAKLLLPNLNEGQLNYVRKTSVFKSF